MNAYPDTADKRRAGMAALRTQMLAVHERQIASGKLKPADIAYQRLLVATIKAAQAKFGEV